MIQTDGHVRPTLPLHLLPANPVFHTYKNFRGPVTVEMILLTFTFNWNLGDNNKQNERGCKRWMYDPYIHFLVGLT